MLGAVAAALLGGSHQGPATWDLTVTTTDVNQTYTVDIFAGTSPRITIDWGDATVETFTSTGQKTHTYATANTYTVKICGSFASGGNIRLGSNAADRARLNGTGIVCWIPGLVNFSATFQNCTGLAGSIPTDLFRYNPQVSTSGFSSTFSGCSALSGSIPTDLFRYNPQVSTSGFYFTFNGCSGLTGSIPTDLFRYNTLVSTNGFFYTFTGCTGLTGSIPTDLFRYNTLVSTSGFYQTFSNCTGLTGSIPTDLFRYNTLVSTGGFYQTFYNCSKLTSAPSQLFKYNTVCTNFVSTFFGCAKLQIPGNLFFDSGEEGTRFLNQTVDFTNFFKITSFTGTQGTAPALWNCDFGTGTPTKTDAFDGHSVSTLSNYGDIPAEWT